MTRPAVSVVMPFAGDAAAARDALATLRGLRLRAGDELILADNSATAPATAGVTIVRATGERSPAAARNAGAQHARGEWILFLDADCRAPADLIDAYFTVPAAPDTGALVGEVIADPDAQTLAARYGAQRNFLSQSAHLAHPFRPRAAAANLMVRRAAFEALGGFLEGLRAAEDTDFSWRLQEAGWRLVARPQATVSHRYRASLSELRRQWRGYAAGRAWLGRRYPDFTPEPAVARALRRARRGRPALSPPGGGPGARTQAPASRPSRLAQAEFLALDAVLSLEELAGLALSNRPEPQVPHDGWQAVLIAERFPAGGDPLVELARALGDVRVEAAERPRELDVTAARQLPIAYREDDGSAERLLAALMLALTHPGRVARDLLGRAPGQPSLRSLAPVVRRLAGDPRVRVLALGGAGTHATAERVARMAGRPLAAAPAASPPPASAAAPPPPASAAAPPAQQPAPEGASD